MSRWLAIAATLGLAHAATAFVLFKNDDGQPFAGLPTVSDDPVPAAATPEPAQAVDFEHDDNPFADDGDEDEGGETGSAPAEPDEPDEPAEPAEPDDAPAPTPQQDGPEEPAAPAEAPAQTPV